MNILYEDAHLIVVNKPAGIATQSAGVGAKDLETELKKYRKTKGEKPEIYVVHRLDQPVSGLIVFAKTKEAAAGLSKGMQEDSYSKDYKATVFSNGNLKKKDTLKDYLIKDAKANISKVVTASTVGAKEAVLDYEVISENGAEATLTVHLHTGRFHQIRAQLANNGTPILGDQKYGTEESKAYSIQKGIKYVMLTAYHLSFKHPKTGKQMDFSL